MELRELTTSEIKNTNGGILINLFLYAVAYGYVCEKIDSGQWHL